MAFIPLTAIGRAGICPAPPWSYRLFSLRTIQYQKGTISEALAPFRATGMNENLAKAQARVRAFKSGRPPRKARPRVKGPAARVVPTIRIRPR